jgi:membrane-bound lytic murein transglycosylase B
MRSAVVSDIQGELVRHGYLPEGSPDGSMGPRTRTAIQEYQRAQGLLVDGKPSAELLEQMRSH